MKVFCVCLIFPNAIIFSICLIQVNVYIQLYRPGDSAISDPVDFRYKPCNNQINDNNRKRQRVSSFYDSNSPSVVEESSHFYATADSFVPQSNMMENESDESADIEKLLANLDELNNLEFNAEGNTFLTMF